MNAPCPKNPCPNEGRGIPFSQLHYTGLEQTILTIARHYFSSFVMPEKHGWIKAISTACDHRGHIQGPHLAMSVLSVVQTMRQSRWSTFHFNSPACTTCAQFVTRNEQALMRCVRASLNGKQATANAYAVILCEGNDVGKFVYALDMLAQNLNKTPYDAPKKQPRRMVWKDVNSNGA